MRASTAPAGQGGRIQHWWPVALVVLTVIATVAASLTSDRDPKTVLNIIAAFGGAAVAGLLVPARPVAAFGVLFILASLTRFVVDLPVGGMRMEQPTTAVVLVTLFVFRSRMSLPSIRPILPIAAAGAVYLGALTASSLLYAPDRGVSLRIVAWSALSMAAGLAAYLLTARAARRALSWVIGTGSVTAIAGIGVATVFFLFGPDIVGVNGERTVIPRIELWAWEVNLYAIYLAAIVPLALEAYRRRPAPLQAAIVIALIAAMALGITRGSWLGLVFGLAIYGLVLLLRRAPRVDLARIAAVSATGAIVGLVLTATLLSPSVQLGHLIARMPAEPTQAPRPSVSPGSTRSPSSPAPSTPQPSRAPLPTLGPGSGANDRTLAFRLHRIAPALEDWKTSPLIGLGAESFGQRHSDPSSGGLPDHIAIMAVAVLYDSGLIGLAALIAVGLLTLRALWRASARTGWAGTAAAALGSLTVLVVAYQATNALHFALNWLLLGVALAVAFGSGASSRSPATETTG